MKLLSDLMKKRLATAGGCPLLVGHEPLPPTVGTTMFGRRVLYLPGFFSYAQHIVKVDGKRGLFRGLSPRLVSSAISTVVRSKVKQVALLSKRDDVQTSLGKVVKESEASFAGWKKRTSQHPKLGTAHTTPLASLINPRQKQKRTSHEMVVQCLSRVATHPFHVMSVRCMAQFVGREVKYGGMFSCIIKIFKEEGVAGFYVGLVPHVLGEVLFLWCCNLLAHFINTYAVDESFSQASAVRSYTKFVMGIAAGCRSSSSLSRLQVLAALLESPEPQGSPLQRIQLLFPPGACDLPALHRGLTSSSSSPAGMFFLLHPAAEAHG
ncbi:mitochondrial carrier homolog 1-like isoform X4 [Siniperca chuatsi]|uniref:mitochondrial carrier homolog 1-like isoform X4 n=1 Tax=Siniperca chuatsi TaxID=119488 RepID=UPI001CE1F3B2|nr:mitochondrial carrier homolog 1-like isoform X4 [Siniperca chuatsi]